MNERFWRDVRALLANRQPALGYLVALGVIGVGIDLLTARVVDELPSFSSFARDEFHDEVAWHAFAALGGASALAWVVLLLSIPVSAVVLGWLTACYLTALVDGRYALRAPRRTVVTLTQWALLNLLISLGLSGLSIDVSAGIAQLVALALIPPLLFGQYAIVVDGCTLPGSIVRSLRLFRVRPRAAVGATFAIILVNVLVYTAFANGFEDKTHVQPTYLVAWVFANVLLSFATDVLLLTLYRETRLSAGGSAGSSAGPSTSTPSD